MVHSIRLPVLAVFAGWLTAISSATAITPEVRDEANLFKPATIKKANEEIKEIKHRYRKDLAIETFKAVPAGKEQEAKSSDSAVKGRFFRDWDLERSRGQELNGIYILIAKEPPHVQVVVGNATQRKAFTEGNRDRLRDILVGRFREKQFDQGLLDGIDYVRQTLREQTASAEAVPPVPSRTSSSPRAPLASAQTGSPLLGWLCIGAVVLLVGWLVVGLIRAFTGGGAGGGYGSAPGGGGFGGGGLMTGLMGGLFGAVAGSWMYDHFFRGDSGHAGGWGASQAHGSEPGSSPDAPQDTDYSSSGGDFGGDAGGGDFGGGDFGGGDFGGGGDY